MTPLLKGLDPFRKKDTSSRRAQSVRVVLNDGASPLLERLHSSRKSWTTGPQRVHPVLGNTLRVAASSGSHRRLVSTSSSGAACCCRGWLHEDCLIPCSRRVTATLGSIRHALVVGLRRLGAEVLADDGEDFAGTARPCSLISPMNSRSCFSSELEFEEVLLFLGAMLAQGRLRDAGASGALRLVRVNYSMNH